MTWIRDTELPLVTNISLIKVLLVLSQFLFSGQWYYHFWLSLYQTFDHFLSTCMGSQLQLFAETTESHHLSS